MYLVDTSVLIWILRGQREYIRWFESIEQQQLFLSTITVAEIYKNVFPVELIRTEEILNEFSILDVTVSIAKQSGFYWQQFSKKYKNFHILDCIIAATAKEHHLTLITLNLRYFPMDDIKLYKGKLLSIQA